MSQNNIASILASIASAPQATQVMNAGQNALINFIGTAIKQMPDSPAKNQLLQTIVTGTALDPNVAYEEAHQEVEYDQAISRVGSVIFVDDSEWESDEVDKVFDGDLSYSEDFADAHDSNSIETVVSSLDTYIANLQAARAAILKAQAEGGKYITYSNSSAFDFERGREVGD